MRIIPAHAGSTPNNTVEFSNIQDHPRSRGEHTVRHRSDRNPHGSSPLTRGAPGRKDTRECRRRIIPAHVGSTCAHERRVLKITDHPRSRGEHSGAFPSLRWKRGSSPLTRGAPTSRRTVMQRFGIIPAHAGSTLDGGDAEHARTDHPRSRGEHPIRRGGSSSSIGSSPLTRGAPFLTRGNSNDGTRFHSL